ncbi:hypothetical protein [Leucobacter aridicollis]|uniref:Uncharacterized protein n=1 Tax=Leucobacter aridicollis TaxID=283878 RepID=A0A852RCJ1_9MICO|nr:hypothetical protein [Leucobacter aridicollis]NYD26064.1 hypothetical protein [Leucobacter aridicollis]
MNTEHEASLPLGLRSILIDSLPAELLTDAAPSHYTVEAVFNRRVTEGESRALLGPESLRKLQESGYPEVKLGVSDRRLNIENTTLEELRDGLASVLTQMLAEISGESERKQAVADQRLKEHLENERQRLESVTELARSVVFTLPTPEPHSPAVHEPTLSDREEIANWVDEGGARNS